MTGSKSKAQIKRMMMRAEARGESYVPPEPTADRNESDDGEKQIENPDDDSPSAEALPNPDKVKMEAAKALEKELENIQKDESMKSKDRRSAKRKAEAIATEASGCAVNELLEWYEEYNKSRNESSEQNANQQDEKKKRNPYIVFVGQLSYDTTKETLFTHFEKELSAEHKITEETMSIRLLTDAKTKKSRGMAFIEVTDPELLYSCLKLHLTFLEGRRINVERSAGGKTKSEARKSKIKTLRNEQSGHFSTVVDAMFTEHYDNGSIKKGEVDDGVVALCKRHSAAVVQSALEEYVEKQGRDMDNPSAYLTYLIGKLAEEGIFLKDDDGNKIKTSSFKSRNSSSGTKEPPNKKPKTAPSMASKGIDMSISKATGKNANDLNSIFPSYNRGRGRGRPSF